MTDLVVEHRHERRHTNQVGYPRIADEAKHFSFIVNYLDGNHCRENVELLAWDFEVGGGGGLIGFSQKF